MSRPFPLGPRSIHTYRLEGKLFTCRTDVAASVHSLILCVGLCSVRCVPSSAVDADGLALSTVFSLLALTEAGII